MKMFFNNSIKYGSRNSTVYRTYDYVLSKCVEEQGELSQEIQIENGLSYKKAGKDGVQGEAVDLAIAALDMFALSCPNMNAQEMEELFISIAEKKIQKWNEKTPPEEEYIVKSSESGLIQYSNLQTGIHYSRKTEDIGFNIDDIVTWSDANYGTVYLEDPAEVLDSTFCISYFGGDEIPVNICIELYDDAKELFNIFNDKISSRITIKDIEETRSLILFRSGPYGIIVSDLNLSRFGITHQDIITLNQANNLSDLCLLTAYDNNILRGFKPWGESDEMTHFFECVQEIRDCYNITNLMNGLGLTNIPSSSKLTHLLSIMNHDLPQIYWEGAYIYEELLKRVEQYNKIDNTEYLCGDKIEMQYELNGSYKFYNVEFIKECSIKIGYGKIGSSETYQIKTFDTKTKAQEFFTKKVLEKFKSGYSIKN